MPSYILILKEVTDLDAETLRKLVKIRLYGNGPAIELTVANEIPPVLLLKSTGHGTRRLERNIQCASLVSEWYRGTEYRNLEVATPPPMLLDLGTYQHEDMSMGEVHSSLWAATPGLIFQDLGQRDQEHPSVATPRVTLHGQNLSLTEFHSTFSTLPAVQLNNYGGLGLGEEYYDGAMQTMYPSEWSGYEIEYDITEVDGNVDEIHEDDIHNDDFSEEDTIGDVTHEDQTHGYESNEDENGDRVGGGIEGWTAEVHGEAREDENDNDCDSDGADEHDNEDTLGYKRVGQDNITCEGENVLLSYT